MDQSFKHTFTVSIDIHIDGDNMNTHEFEIECYSWNNGERDPEWYQEQDRISFLSEQPDWMSDNLRKILEQKAWDRFTFNISEYQED